MLDYDQIVGGQPVFLVRGVTGDVTLQAIYSQSLPYLLPGGDGFGTNNNAGERTISFVGVPGGAQLSQVDLGRGQPSLQGPAAFAPAQRDGVTLIKIL